MKLVPTTSTLIAALLLLTGAPAQAAPAGAAEDPILQAISLSATGRSAATQRDTQPFGLVGATWADPRAVLGGTVEVRTRAIGAGRWTGWQTLDSDEPSPADAGGRGRTDPLWVGMSDAVEVRVSAGGPLPRGLRLDLINPDAAVPEQQPRARVDVPGRPMPKLVTRSGWRANERIVKDPPEYTTDVQVMFVHHTAGTNGYRCADSARIVRAIEGYHVTSNHWNDIGYNFLVDKCGSLFEGRKGGVGRAVLGAHTLGFNAHSAAIAVIGDYRGLTVPPVVRNVIAQVAAYKLGTYGNLATGRTMLESGGTDRFPKGRLVSLNRVSGHRDAGSTTCPGNALYGQLGSIRAIAGAGPAGLRLLSMIGATGSGSTYRTRGLVSPLWTTSTPSALINRFDVYVDGELAASARNMHRRAALRLSPGQHTVTVRAIHLSGRSASFTVRVVAGAQAQNYSGGRG